MGNNVAFKPQSSSVAAHRGLRQLKVCHPAFPLLSYIAMLASLKNFPAASVLLGRMTCVIAVTHSAAWGRLPQRANLGLSKHDHRGILQVECAINRATKEKRVAELTDLLERSDVAFAVRYNKVSVKNFENFRRSLPSDAKLCVAKNTLMKQAVSRVSVSSLFYVQWCCAVWQ